MHATAPRRIYIAGPMRGHDGHGYDRFVAATGTLRDRGFAVVSPHEVNAAWMVEMIEHRGLALEGPDYMRRDIPELLNCNAIHLLPGWETSTGARCEAAIAITCGHTFVDAHGHPCPAPARVTIAAGGYALPPGRIDTLDDLRDENIAWANATFGPGHERRASVWAHLAKEVGELRDEPNDLEEMADVFLLLAHGSAGLDLVGAVRAKLEKNKRRTWGQPDADGVVEHIAEAAS